MERFFRLFGLIMNWTWVTVPTESTFMRRRVLRQAMHHVTVFTPGHNWVMVFEKFIIFDFELDILSIFVLSQKIQA